MAVIVRTRTESALLDRRRLQVTRAAAEAAVKMGFNVDRIIEMAYAGAPVQDQRANFRYDDVLLFVEQDTVYGVWPYAEAIPRRSEPPPRREPPRPTRNTLPDRVCPICDGEGKCNECQDRGTVRRTDDEYERLKFLALTGG